jgi:hypothetical protein
MCRALALRFVKGRSVVGRALRRKILEASIAFSIQVKGRRPNKHLKKSDVNSKLLTFRITCNAWQDLLAAYHIRPGFEALSPSAAQQSLIQPTTNKHSAHQFHHNSSPNELLSSPYIYRNLYQLVFKPLRIHHHGR